MAKYSDIKGFTVQTVSADPAASAAASGSWASGGDMNTTHAYAGGAGTQTAGLVFGGVTPAQTANTESYDGSSWTEVNNMNSAVGYLQSAGVTYTAALGIGGHRPSNPTAFTESWDGTNWTEVADLNTARSFAGSNGSATSALIYGGIDPSYPPHTGKTESWNGSSWTEVSDLNTVREVNAGFGVNNSNAISAGGSPGPTTVESWDGSSWTEVSEVNTGRNAGSGFGTYDDGIFCGGGPGGLANTEAWNGSSWTEVADLANARNALRSGYGCPSSVGIAFGGTSPPSSTYRAFTEEWTTSFTPTTLKKITEGQLFFNSTANAFKETITDIPGATWSSGGSTNTAREFAGRAGTQTAGLTFGGAGTPSALAITEQYDGSSWTEVADLNTARGYLLLGNGPYTAALCSGGDVNPPAGSISVSAINESWDGSSWTEVGDLNTARTLTGQFGASNTSSIVAGGYNNTANVDNNESWDGSSWTEIAEQNTARRSLAAMGIATAGILASGNGPTADVELWDGTSWTETTNVNTARTNLSGSGTQTSSIIYGGRTSGFEDKTEFWNGTSWTELNNLSTGRSALGGSPAGTSSSALAYLGQTPSATTATEEWTANLSNKTITTG